VVAADGTIGYCVPDNRQAWHAKSYNASHLGIEFVKRSPYQYQDVVTEAQYKSAAWWLVDMSRKYGFALNIATLPEHRQIQSDKIDIGTGFDRSRLIYWVKEFQG
jgi:N-acetyl-anhydromuramyl-L-alanine amidase AmpD